METRNTTQEQAEKMIVCGNVQNMQSICGLRKQSIDELLKYSYDQLHEKQIKLIPKYNEAIKKRPITK